MCYRAADGPNPSSCHTALCCFSFLNFTLLYVYFSLYFTSIFFSSICATAQQTGRTTPRATQRYADFFEFFFHFTLLLFFSVQCLLPRSRRAKPLLVPHSAMLPFFSNFLLFFTFYFLLYFTSIFFLYFTSIFFFTAQQTGRTTPRATQRCPW